MRHVSLKQLLILGMGGVLCAVLLLAAGWLLSLAELQSMKQRLFTDATSLQVSQSLELAVTTASQQHLLWRTTGEVEHRDEAARQWRAAARLVKALPSSATSDEEQSLVREIEDRFQALMRLNPETANGSRAGSAALLAATEALLDAVHRHRSLNERQMQETMQAGNQLERNVRLGSAVILLTALAALGWGGLKLWTRIFRPMLQLSQAAAAFGRGEPQARAPILWRDEMGELCETFNAMAQSISDREKERLDFVAAVAHDLKTPLVVIGGAANLLKNKVPPPDEQKRWLTAIVKSARSLEGIIADLTNGVQAQTGRLELQRAIFDLNELAAEVARSLDEMDIEHTLRCESAELAPVWGDRARLERVVQNLVSNALKYSPRGSEVRLIVEARETVVLLRVEDEGIGIAPEDVARVFQPFQRLERARAMATGIGMGLASARKIVEAHGGFIRIMSEPAHGTTVEVRLPRATAGTPDLPKESI